MLQTGNPLTTLSTAPAVPHSREAEEGVVGSVLINPDVYYDVARFLVADDFYIHRNKWIWEAFGRLHEQRIPVDLLTLAEELDRASQLTDAGGPAYLMSLINQVPSSLNAESYGRIIEAHSIRRALIANANEQATRAYNEELPISELLDGSVSRVLSLQQRTVSDNRMVTMREGLSILYDRIDDIAKNGKPESIPTHFYDLDKILHGLHKQKLYIVATRPGLGKSALLTSIAGAVANIDKKHVAIFSLEMENIELITRLMSIHKRLSSRNIADGRLADSEWPIFTSGVEEMGSWPIVVDDTPSITPESLFAKARRLKQKGELDLLIVDYIQIMGIADKWGYNKNRNREQEVSHMARMLKFIARELNIPVLAAAQVNRAVDARAEKKLFLSDLRESGSLEQEADAVIFLQPPSKDAEAQKESARDVEVAKQRNGPIGTCQLLFRGEYTGFYNLRRENDSKNWWD